MKGEELISRTKAIEVLRNANTCPVHHGPLPCASGCFFRFSFYKAIEALAALPVVPTDGDLISELHECLAMHHTAAYDLRQDIIEILTHFSVPLVPQSDHVLKVEMGETTSYQLTCNLGDDAACHKVCGVHPEGGCDDPDNDGPECSTHTYEGGCIVAEWVNDGGIEAVEFEHTIEIPVGYQWNASHDYPSIFAAPVPLDRLNEAKGDLK
jgi:hypothetical protein